MPYFESFDQNFYRENTFIQHSNGRCSDFTIHNKQDSKEAKNEVSAGGSWFRK